MGPCFDLKGAQRHKRKLRKAQLYAIVLDNEARANHAGSNACRNGAQLHRAVYYSLIVYYADKGTEMVTSLPNSGVIVAL